MNQPDLFTEEPAASRSTPVRGVSSLSSVLVRQKRLLIGIVAGVAALMVAATLWMTGDTAADAAQDGEPVRIPGPGAVQVEVLNAAGGMRLAQRFTDHLRRQGFDVVEVGNSPARNIEHTVVLDRTGRPDGARHVAEALGLPPDRVIQELNRNLMVDVTVLIGRDYGSLRTIPHTTGESR